MLTALQLRFRISQIEKPTVKDASLQWEHRYLGQPPGLTPLRLQPGHAPLLLPTGSSDSLSRHRLLPVLPPPSNSSTRGRKRVLRGAAAGTVPSILLLGASISCHGASRSVRSLTPPQHGLNWRHLKASTKSANKIQADSSETLPSHPLIIIKPRTPQPNGCAAPGSIGLALSSQSGCFQPSAEHPPAVRPMAA